MTDHWAIAVEAAMDGYVAPEEDGFGGGRPLLTDMQACMDAALRAALPHLVEAVVSKVYEQTHWYKLVESPLWPGQMREAVESLTGTEWPDDA